MSEDALESEPDQPELDVLAPWGPGGPPPAGYWSPDVLGPDYQARSLPLLADEEGDGVATLVRYRPDPPPSPPRAVFLYLHGRNDYFFQTELAETLSRAGVRFYALDLRKYGRSLRPGQTIGYTEDFYVYEEEIGLALEIIREEDPDLPLVLMGHSTGGLLATLWAHRHPGAVAGVVLNSAWLELQSLAAWRPALQQVIGRIAALRPRAVVIANDGRDVYGPSISGGWAASGLPLPESLAGFETDPAVTGWALFPEWKRDPSYPVPAAWLGAILEAQDQVEKQVHLDCPVLSVCSSSSASAEEWSPAVFASDIVLDPEVIVDRSARLSDLVTIARLPGRHDLALSDPPIRQRYYRLIEKWLDAVLPEDSSAEADR